MDIMELARQEDALYIQSCPDWDEKEVWQLLFYDPESGPQSVGIPYLAVVESDGARIMSDEEIAEYMKQISGESEEPFIGEVLKVA